MVISLMTGAGGYVLKVVCFRVEVTKGRLVVTCICPPNISQNHLSDKALVMSVRNFLESMMHSVCLLQ